MELERVVFAGGAGGAAVKITYKEFLAEVAGARALNREWIVESLFEQFCFDDKGCYYMEPKQREEFREVSIYDRKLSELDWGAEVADNPGYMEPEKVWMLH